MTLLSHNQLIDLVNSGVIENVKDGAINASSIDIHLGEKIVIEQFSNLNIDYYLRQSFTSETIIMDKNGYRLEADEFILAQSREVFNLPDNISAEYKLKSSMARIGFEHMNAGWCDAGWHGSVLTLELKNMLRYHEITIRPGDAIGQMIFFEHEAVPQSASYATKGRYNNDKTVSAIKE